MIGLAAAGCATIPKGQYGVDDIEWIGMKDMSPEALESCLVTRERDAVHVRLGLGAPTCGQPPFDSHAPSFQLWTLPWTEWPIYDPAIFAVERQRIERWYAARGYFHAKVVDVRTYVNGKLVDSNECHGSGSDCELKIVVQLDEGKPTYVKEVSLESTAKLPPELMAKMRKKLELAPGRRFDEASYEADKTEIKKRLDNASYARSKVSGKVVIDRETRDARVIYKLEPGPPCVFGVARVEGADDVPSKLILQAANIPTGKPFEQDDVEDAQRAIFALKVFNSVKIEPQGDGRVVDLLITVQRGRVVKWGAGVGMMSGVLRTVTSDETIPIPQWDVHLKGSYDNRNFLGGLRRLTIEERPRLIFLHEFPAAPGGPRLGNLVSLSFEQPSTFEARTKLFFAAAWDAGPDPYFGFFRNDITMKVGLERSFWKQRVLGRFAVEQDFYQVGKNVPAGVADYKLPFLEQYLVLDLRDNPGRPKLGIWVAASVQEASQLGHYGTWDYVRALPEIRGYAPLLWDVVIAARFKVGVLKIFNENAKDAIVGELGPERYRLRGGGGTDNRGFQPGELGDGLIGGTRSWLGSLEMRIPLGGDFGVVGFGDVGDVHTPAEHEPQFRFNHLNLAVGGGLRYLSVLGALRLDLAWRVPSLQVIGGKPDEPVRARALPNAVHLTIGEAF